MKTHVHPHNLFSVNGEAGGGRISGCGRVSVGQSAGLVGGAVSADVESDWGSVGIRGGVQGCVECGVSGGSVPCDGNQHSSVVHLDVQRWVFLNIERQLTCELVHVITRSGGNDSGVCEGLSQPMLSPLLLLWITYHWDQPGLDSRRCPFHKHTA